MFLYPGFPKMPTGTPCVGGWRLAVGGWRLAVDGPLGRSLRAKNSVPKDRPAHEIFPILNPYHQWSLHCVIVSWNTNFMQSHFSVGRMRVEMTRPRGALHCTQCVRQLHTPPIVIPLGGCETPQDTTALRRCCAAVLVLVLCCAVLRCTVPCRPMPRPAVLRCTALR